MRRVVVTGMAAFSPIGNDWPTMLAHLRDQQTGIEYMADWERYAELNTRLGAPVHGFKRPRALYAQTGAQHGAAC